MAANDPFHQRMDGDGKSTPVRGLTRGGKSRKKLTFGKLGFNSTLELKF